METGWTAGAGFEYAFQKYVTLRAEYLYVNLGSGHSVTETAVSTVPGTVPASFNANFSNSAAVSIVRLGLNFHL